MSGRHHSCPEVFRMATQMSVSVRETLPDVWETLTEVPEWSEGPPGCPGVIEIPSRMTGSVRESFPVVRERSGDPAECSGAFRRPTDKQEWWRGPPRCQGSVGMPSRMFGSFWNAPRIPGSGEALPDVREWLGCPPECLGVVASPFRIIL